MGSHGYDIEGYWSRVGEEIGRRGESVVAGDANGFYHYKREKFLQRFLGHIEIDGKKVLELGPGPGGNLRQIAQTRRPKKLYGCDISQVMLNLAAGNLAEFSSLTELRKTDGRNLPFEDHAVDVTYTVTVLQHNTDADGFKRVVGELCRITKETIYAFEDIGRNPGAGGEGTWVGRTVDTYRDIFAESGFGLIESKFLNLRFSERWYDKYRGWAKLGQKYKEGEAIPMIHRVMITLPLLLTRFLDDAVGDTRGLAMMTFKRRDLAPGKSRVRLSVRYRFSMEARHRHLTRALRIAR